LADAPNGADTESEGNEQQRRRQRKAQPCRQCARQPGTRNPNRHPDLAARRARKKLAERDEIRVASLIEPLSTYDVLVMKVPQVRNGPAKGSEAETQSHPKNLEKRPLITFYKFSFFYRCCHSSLSSSRQRQIP
jgi:hypothetical protein